MNPTSENSHQMRHVALSDRDQQAVSDPNLLCGCRAGGATLLSQSRRGLNTFGALALLLGFIGFTPVGHAAWSAGTYPDLQTTYDGDHIIVSYQGAPPPSNDSTPTWRGFPANMASTQKSNFLLATPASFSSTGSAWTGHPTLQVTGGTSDGLGTSRNIWVWANRRNDSSQTNYTCNLIAPTAPNGNGVNGITLRRTVPLPWEDLTGSPGPYYQAGEVVVDETDAYSPHHWYRLKEGMTQTSPSSIPPHSDPDWEDVGYGSSEILPPVCRFEYKNYAGAVASNIVQTKWLAGEPAYEWTGSSTITPWGFIDVADVYDLDVYCFGQNPTNIIPANRVVDMTYGNAADDIFTLRPLAVDRALGSNTNFAVKGGQQTADPDGVYLPINRLADIWSDYAMAPYVDLSDQGGWAWEFGEVVRDDQSVLPNNFAQYDGSSYTVNLGGLIPPAFPDSFQSTYNNGHLEGYVELDASGTAVIRHRYPLPADSSNYLVTVTGWFTEDISATGNSRILLKCTGLTSGGSVVAAGTASVPKPAMGSGLTFQVARDEYRQFKFQHVFNSSGSSIQGIPATAFPSASDLVRLGVFVQNGTVQLTSVLVQKITTSDPLPTPTYWQCVAPGVPPTNGYTVSAPSDRTTFTPFADVVTNSPPGTWQPQKLGVVLDYEVSDLRPINAAADTMAGDGNVIYFFSQLKTALNAEGYLLHVYTNDIDQRNNTPIKNALTNANLNDVLENVDVLLAVADGANFRGNSIPAAIGACYNTLRYELETNPASSNYGNPVSPLSERSNFNVDKVGIVLPLSDPYMNNRAPVTGVSTKTIGGTDYYQISVDTGVASSGTIAGAFINLDGFAPPYDSIFNGKTFHVVQGGTNIVIDQVVDYTDPRIDANGLLIDYGLDPFIPTLPIATYQGGGIAGGGGSTKDDFQYAVDNFIENTDSNYQVKHWDMWRWFASQNAYESAENPTSLENVTMELVSIRLAGDGHTLILIADSSAPWVSDFPHRTLFTGKQIHSITLEGFTGSLAPLNGCTFQPIFSGTDPDSINYNVHRFALRGFDGAGFGLTAGVTTSLSAGPVAVDASTHDVNRKLGIIAFGATP